MTGILLDISKISRTIADCLIALQKEADVLRVQILLVGATARELLFAEYGITGRATVDVDIAVLVGDWTAYNSFMQRLKSTALFTPDVGSNHRLCFQGLPVDVIPFGGIETEAGNIVWPDDTGTMNMAGFQDVYKHALSAAIWQGEKISVASLPGMAVLKIVAWDDRHNEFPTKDADDLALILRYYAEAGNSERLYEEHPDFVTDVGGDLELAGARLLGFDMAAIMSLSTKQVVQKILAHNTDPGASDKLVEAILRYLPDRSYERALLVLQNLQKGIGGE